MDDQNKNSQPLNTSGMPVIPDKPEDITPLPSPTTIPVEPMAADPLPPMAPQPIEPVMTPPSVPEMPIVPDMPAPTVPSPVEVPFDTSVPEPTPSVPTDPPMPEAKPKSKVWPIVGGIVALLLVVGVAGAAYYVSNQLSTRQAVAPNAPSSKPAAAEEMCDTSSTTAAVCRGQAVGFYSCCGAQSPGCVEYPLGTGNLFNAVVCERTTDTYCGAKAVNVTVANWPSVCGGSTTSTPAPTVIPAPTCIDYVYIPNPTSEQEKQLICNPNRGDIIRTVSFSKAGRIRIHIEGAAAGTTVRLLNGNADVQVTKIDDKNFESNVVASSYGIIVRLGNESSDSLGYLKPSSNGICQRYGEPRDVSSRMTTAALNSFGIASIDGVDAAIQCWADTLQGSDTDERGQLDANYDFNDFDIEIGYKTEAQPTVTIEPTVTILPTATVTEPPTTPSMTTNKQAYADNPANTPGVYIIPDGTVPIKKIAAGATFVYYINATNTGTSPVVSTIKDVLPLDVTFVDSHSWCSYTATTRTVTCRANQTYQPNQMSGSAFRVKVNSYLSSSVIHNVSKLTYGSTTIEAVKDLELAPPDAVGACMLISVYKKVNGVYGTIPLTLSQLQALKIGDVLKFTVNASMDGLQGRFRVTISNTAGGWLTGVTDPTNKKLLTYSDYTVPSVGTYKFEAQVTTAP